MSPKIVDKEEKKRQIIHASLQVFAKYGITKSKMSEIALTAGIGKGTIYEYFRSKEEIFSEAFSMLYASLMTMIKESVAATDDPYKKLENIVAISMDFFHHDASDFASVMMDFWAEGIRTKNKMIQQAIDLKKIYRDYRIIIEEIVNQGVKKNIFKKVDSKAFSAITIAALDGIYLQLIIDPNVINVQHIKKTFSDTLLKGLIK